MKINNIISGRFLSNDKVVHRLPIIVYLIMLTLLYIYNIFHTQHQYREILRIEKEISKLKVTSTTTHAKKVSVTRESFILDEIARRKVNIIESKIPPKTIRTDEQ